uniref:Uncharacterized protein n=1 Tax=Tetranychus urticae TaxID=32264 RepID=T1K4N5_TETUR
MTKSESCIEMYFAVETVSNIADCDLMYCS